MDHGYRKIIEMHTPFIKIDTLGFWKPSVVVSPLILPCRLPYILFLLSYLGCLQHDPHGHGKEDKISLFYFFPLLRGTGSEIKKDQHR